MPTAVSAARQCLAPEAAAALDEGVAVARRRSHAQTTSLHVVSALLSLPSSSSSFLRDALTRTHNPSSPAFPPRLHFKALELCFFVALDRLPSSTTDEEPLVSNSLMAAIKRSQANQRRNPETFHLYYQTNHQHQSPPFSGFSGVKVELQQLILSILDDPVVSRVFAEAGYRSCDIKIAVLRPSPSSILRFPSRCPPLFLCSFSDTAVPFSSDASGENCRRIGEILARRKARNPLLVGAGAADALRDFEGLLEAGRWDPLPREMAGIRIVGIGWGGDGGWMRRAKEELVGTGVVVSVGDLKAFVDGEEDGRVVGEVSRMLGECGERMWVLGCSATYEVYMKFLARYPNVDKDWDLQLLPITSVRLDRWPTPPVQAKDGGTLLNEKIIELQKKWNDVCQHPHCGSKDHDSGHKSFPRILGFPITPSNGSSVNQNNDIGLVRSFSDNELSVGIGLDSVRMTKRSLTVSIISELSDTAAFCDQKGPLPRGTRTDGLHSNSSSHSELVTHIDHTSLTSAASVSTDLVLGSSPVSSSNKRSSLQLFVPLLGGTTKCKPFLKSSITNRSIPITPFLSPPYHSGLDSLQMNSMVGMSSNTWISDASKPGGHKVDEKCLNSPNMSLQLGWKGCKVLYKTLFEKVCRQEEAINEISDTITRCRTATTPHHGIWLNFIGPDSNGKKRIAVALAEILFGDKRKLIHVDLDVHDGKPKPNFVCDQPDCMHHENFRGKVVVDHIFMEISNRHWSVVLLENVDKADVLVQGSLSQAIKTGRFHDSHGREISISNSIFIITTKEAQDNTVSSKDRATFCEERILTAEKWQMRILIETACNLLCSYPNSSSSNKSWGIPFAGMLFPCSIYVNKRKIIGDQGDEEPQKSPNSVKRVHKALDVFLDLNIPFEETIEGVVENSSTESNLTSSENFSVWLEKFFGLVDKTVHFKPFDFDSLADYITKEISKYFQNSARFNTRLEIEAKAMEQMLAATWLLDDMAALSNWLQHILVKAFVEALKKCDLSSHTVLRLVACEESVMEEDAAGIRLPSKIIIG